MRDVFVGVAVIWAGFALGCALTIWVREGANDTWEQGAIGVYEKTIVCEKSLDTWVCKREEK